MTQDAEALDTEAPDAETPVPNRRRYRSELRARRAARTRASVLEAAKVLFEGRGFAATTIAAIAEEAGVSQQTVYASFGSKPALLRAILEQQEESAQASVWRERIASEQQPARILAAFAHWSCAFFEASSPALTIAPEAAAELADLVAQGDRHRRRALEALVERLSGMGALRAGLSPAHAVDRLWLLTGVQTYAQARHGCGWSAERYRAWLAETLAQQVL